MHADLVLERPLQCWSLQDHPFARELLNAIPAFLSKGRPTTAAHQRRLTQLKELWCATSDGVLDHGFFEQFVARHGAHTSRIVVDLFPGDGAIGKSLRTALKSVMAQTRRAAASRYGQRQASRKGARPSAPAPEPLPPEFAEGLDWYKILVLRRQALKREKGHSFSDETVHKMRSNARRFARFLARSGHSQWGQVTQLDIDGFVNSTNHSAAAIAWTFMQSIKSRYRLTQTLLRPRVRTKAAAEVAADFRETPSRIKRLLTQRDPEIALAGLLVVLYGQTLKNLSTLTPASFRVTDHKVSALLAEVWLDMDPVTSRLVRKVLLELSWREKGAEPISRLFLKASKTLGRALYRILGVHAKPLRLAALANIIRNGSLDRAGLVRALGFSLPTIAKTERMFEWDLQQTVAPDLVERRNAMFMGETGE